MSSTRQYLDCRLLFGEYMLNNLCIWPVCIVLYNKYPVKCTYEGSFAIPSHDTERLGVPATINIMQYNVMAYVWNSVDFTAWKKWRRERKERRLCSNLGPIISHSFSHATYQSQSWSFVSYHLMHSHKQAMPMTLYKAMCICNLLPVISTVHIHLDQSAEAPTRTLKRIIDILTNCGSLHQWLIDSE